MNRWLWACLALTVSLWAVNGQQQCNRQADVSFILDGSVGISSAEFEQLKTLIINYVRTKNASPTSQVVASVILVSNGVEKRIELTDDIDQFESAVIDLNYPAGGTVVTDTGIEVAFSDLLLQNSPSGTFKTIIVMTSQPAVSAQTSVFNADFARDIGIEVFAIGLKSTMPQSQLLLIGGDAAHVRRITNILSTSTLPDIPLNLDNVDCGSVVTNPPTVRPPTTPSTTRPTTRPTTPSTLQTTRPTTRPTTRRTVPTTRPTVPTTRPTVPTTRRTVPTTRRTVPTTRRTVPTTRRTVPTTRPTVPTTRRTVPTTRPTTRRTTPRTTRRTTPRSTRPPTTVSTTTFRPLPTDSLCKRAVIVGTVGYTYHPTDPDSYIQCYFPQPTRSKRDTSRVQSITILATNAVAVIRQCSYGLFWNQESRRCEMANSVRVQADSCSNSNEMSRPINGNCRGYFRCVNGRSVPSCCPPGTAYSKFGCLTCPSCMDSCNMATNMQYACGVYPVWNDFNSYRVWQWDRDGGTYVTKTCSDGCYYNLASCDCAFKPWTKDNTTDTTCGAKVDVSFFNIGSNAYTLNNVVVQQNGNAFFNSPDASIRIQPDQSYADYNGPVVIELRYMEMTELKSRQALVQSASCPRAGLLLVTVDRESILLEVSTDQGTLTSLKVPTIGFKPNEFKTLRIVDNNDYISITVSNGQDAYMARARAPASPYLQCGLDVGNAQYVDTFQGIISSISLYQCIPDTMVA